MSKLDIMKKFAALNTTKLEDVSELISDKKKSFTDDRMFKLSVGALKGGEHTTTHTTVRILPREDRLMADGTAKAVEPWLNYHIHNSFKPSLYAPCSADYGHDCPICEHATAAYEAYAKGGKVNKELLEYFKNTIRKDKFVVNILVISDPITPENEGKVFLYELPMSIQRDILKLSTTDAIPDEQCAAWSLFEGANLVICYKKGAGTKTYEGTKFVKHKSPISDFIVTQDGESKDDALVRVLEAMYKLETITDATRQTDVTYQQVLERYIKADAMIPLSEVHHHGIAEYLLKNANLMVEKESTIANQKDKERELSRNEIVTETHASEIPEDDDLPF